MRRVGRCTGPTEGVSSGRCHPRKARVLRQMVLRSSSSCEATADGHEYREGTAAGAVAKRRQRMFYASVAAYAATTWATQFAVTAGTAGSSRSGEAMPGTRNGRFRRSSVPVMPRNRRWPPLNRQIRSVVSNGSAGAIYAYRRVGQRWRSGGSCESGLAFPAGLVVVTVRLSHRAGLAGQLIWGRDGGT